MPLEFHLIDFATVRLQLTWMKALGSCEYDTNKVHLRKNTIMGVLLNSYGSDDYSLKEVYLLGNSRDISDSNKHLGR
jgi:hypothetical protein